MFKTEADSMEYLISVRWPYGPICPSCHCDQLWRNDGGRVLERVVSWSVRLVATGCGPWLGQSFKTHAFQ
ncbi:MAG: transposase [Deltaproteobacteria bacterium]|nr:transposase [Deltaproteobacteria bacterium]